MNEYFRMLGLSEDASKEDVQLAYHKWMEKYKSPDYADDPEYVKEKLATLSEAYKVALSLAGTGAAGSDYRESHSNNRYDNKYERKEKKPKIKYDFKSQTEKKETVKLAGIIISLLMVVLPVIISQWGDTYTGYDEPDKGEFYITDVDSEVRSVGDDIYSSLTDYRSYGEEESTDSEIKEEADRFAQLYFGMDSIEELTEYARTEYYYDFEGYTYWETVEDTLLCFNMPDYYSCLGAAYVSDEVGADIVNCPADYIRVLNDYYVKHHGEFEYI